MADLEESVKEDTKKRTVDGKRASQQFLEMGVTPTASASSPINDGGSVTFTITTSHVDGLRIFAIEHISVYETSVSNDNKIPSGDNISVNDYEVAFWYDWGSTNNKNIKFIVWVYNKSGSNQTILLRINSRFIVEITTSGAT